jgi:hypothetical protein
MNNNKQQTAVDIAFEKLANQGLLVTRDYKNLVVYREAKEIEKKQIIEAYKYGNQSDVYFKPEQYYNETFNN